MSERVGGFGNYLYSDPKGLGIEEIQIRTGAYTLWSPGQETKTFLGSSGLSFFQYLKTSSVFRSQLQPPRKLLEEKCVERLNAQTQEGG